MFFMSRLFWGHYDKQTNRMDKFWAPTNRETNDLVYFVIDP